MYSLLKSIYSIFSPKERSKGIIVIGLAILLGVLEAAGVASVMPFLAVAGNPEIINEVWALRWAYEKLAFSTTRNFLIFLGTASVGVLIFTSFFRLFANYVQLRFISMRRHSLSKRLFAKMLGQPYEYFLNRNSGDLAKSILSEANEVVNQVLKPLVDVISYGIVSLLIITLLLFIDYSLAMIVSAVLGGAYVLVYLTIRGITRRQGKERVVANKARFEVVGEAFGGVKEVKLRSLENYYLNIFDSPSRLFASTQATNAILSVTPKHVIEAIAFGSVMGIAVYLLTQQTDMGVILPLLGAYVMAGYRLMPALQAIYKGSVLLRFGAGALDSVKKDLDEGKGSLGATTKVSEGSLPEFKETIELKDIRYTYPGTQKVSIDNISLSIPAKTSVGLVGATGAGKTTLVDLMLGLLNPSHGTIFVDSQPINNTNLRAWQRQVGYVPQNIYLVDADITSNIAFGVPKDKIDMEDVQRAAKAAQVHQFITESLPDGYRTRAGERGVRLSGGQRQRLGIARALYHSPKVLIMDEGTSALDSATEAAVMDSVKALARETTVIMIAHRLTTVKDCDQIIVLKDGRIAAYGSFDQLAKGSEEFNRIANTAGGAL